VLNAHYDQLERQFFLIYPQVEQAAKHYRPPSRQDESV
jgi:acyl carrier protein phosphodiesterase